MARIFITGSSEGLGLMAGELLVVKGHEVVLDARTALGMASDVVVGEVSSIAGMRQVAEQANALGRFDAVIHNVGVGYREPKRMTTTDGLSHVFAINVLAPYLLTALMGRPGRLVYLSSGMHRGGNADLGDLQWERKAWSGSQAYADSKFLDMLMAFGVARRWPGVLSNAVEPGWVPTRMGGPSAPDDMALAPVTQAWLAVSEDAGAKVSGEYFRYRKAYPTHPSANNTALQDDLLKACA